MKQTPIAGQTYTYYDDGKVKPSRKGEVVITEVVPFEMASLDVLDFWREGLAEYGFLFAKNTEAFALGYVKNFLGDYPVIYARTVKGGWFDLNHYGGELDVDGKLTEWLDAYMEYYRKK